MSTTRRTPLPARTDQVRIGARIRAARTARALTLDAVAEGAGLTKSFVSRLERDQVSPSVASLVAVCDVVGLRVGELFEPPTTAVVRAGEATPINFGGTGAQETLLSPGTQKQVQVIRSRLLPAAHGGAQLYALDCEVEFVVVLDGRLVVTLGEAEIELGPGDALTFSGHEPHTWRNGSDGDPADVLWVLAPAP